MTIITAFCGCKHKSRVETEITKLSGQTIIFPKGYQIISEQDSLEINSIIKNSPKVITYFPEIPCTDCILKMLYDWQTEIKTLDVPFILVIDSCNKNEIQKGIDKFKIDIPIIMYPINVFDKANNLNVLARNRTFLLDKNNIVLVVGEPFGNHKMKDLYSKTLKKL